MKSTITRDVIDAPQTTALSPREQVVALLNSIESGDTEPMTYIDATKFTQHNLTVADGVAGFGEMLQSLSMFNQAPQVNTVRVFDDGEYVVAHTEYNLFGPKVGFDIFRYDGGHIVEHWDNLQEKATKTNPSGRTMIDGSTRICDEKHTAANRKLVETFVNEVLIGANYSRIATFFDGDKFLQHNPMVGDGLETFQLAMAKMAKDGITMKFTKLHRVFCHGNFALAITEGKYGADGGVATSFYDLFRLHNGKIAEHWDVIEPIIPKAERKNSNGKFGFRR